MREYMDIDDKDRSIQQALQIFPILMAQAYFRKTIIYTKLAALMGYESDRGYESDKCGRVALRALAIIGYYCLMHRKPPINVLVVSKATGKPGDSVVGTPGKSIEEDLRAIFNVKWFRYCITRSDLEKASLEYDKILANPDYFQVFCKKYKIHA